MNNTSGEIRALIALLGDDDVNVRDVARERLLSLGTDAEEFLRDATLADLEGKVRIEARHVLEKIRRDDLISSFYLLGLLDDTEIDLEHAASLLARVGCSDAQLQTCQKELDTLAGQILPLIKELDPQKDGRRIVAHMNHLLFDEEGFCGNVDEYYDPDNSYLNRVLERRTGIPVSLAMIYLLLAKRLNLPIRGINMPMHFVCQYYAPPRSFYFDPFYGGRIITKAECTMIAQRAGQASDDSFLQPASTRKMLGRMVRNLIWIYYQREDMDKALLLDHLLKLLRTSE